MHGAGTYSEKNLLHFGKEIMSTSAGTRRKLASNTGSNWEGLYLIGGVAAILLTVIPVVAILAYFIWPYAPGVMSTEAIFELVQRNPFGALMALDFFVLLGGLVSVLLLLPLYGALKVVDEGLALIALCFGLLSVAAIVAGRPIAEVFVLSEQFTQASTEAERTYALAAGAALLPSFHGTAWMVYGLGMSISYLLSTFLMLKGQIFRRSTAYVGIVTNIFIGLFIIPVVGPLFMFLGTIVGIVWSVQLAREFLLMAQQDAPRSSG
jgi:hypothetical protein